MAHHHGGKLDVTSGVITLKEFFEGARDAGYAQEVTQKGKNFTLTEKKEPVAVVRGLSDDKDYSAAQVVLVNETTIKIIRQIMEKSKEPVLLKLLKSEQAKPFAVLEPL